MAMNMVRYIFCSITTLVVSAAVAHAQLGPAPPQLMSPALSDDPLENFNAVSDIEEHLGAKIPTDLKFTDETGKPVALAEYLNHDRPVILQLGYFECPMLCSAVSKSMVQSLQKMKLDAGTEYDVLYVSIDPQEKWPLAKLKKEATVKALGEPGAAVGWHLLTGEQPSIDALAQATGFKYSFIHELQEFSHPAVLMVLASDGTITRYLYGTKFDPDTMRLSLVEASNGTIGTIRDRFILNCFRFDHTTGRYQRNAVLLLRVSAALTVVVMSAIFVPLWYRSWRAGKKQLMSERKTQAGE